MNEKIRELAERACEYVEEPMPNEIYNLGDGVFRRCKRFDKEKFAELIVRECAVFANEHNSEAEGVTLGIGKAIKQHFGVEE